MKYIKITKNQNLAGNVVNKHQASTVFPILSFCEDENFFLLDDMAIGFSLLCEAPKVDLSKEGLTSLIYKNTSGPLVDLHLLQMWKDKKYLIISYKISIEASFPTKEEINYYYDVREFAEKQASILNLHAKIITAQSYIDLIKPYFNNIADANSSKWDFDVPLCEQLASEINIYEDSVAIGENWIQLYTLRQMPKVCFDNDHSEVIKVIKDRGVNLKNILISTFVFQEKEPEIKEEESISSNIFNDLNVHKDEGDGLIDYENFHEDVVESSSVTNLDFYPLSNNQKSGEIKTNQCLIVVAETKRKSKRIGHIVKETYFKKGYMYDNDIHIMLPMIISSFPLLLDKVTIIGMGRYLKTNEEHIKEFLSLTA